jgi:hypothetical protein
MTSMLLGWPAAWVTVARAAVEATVVDGRFSAENQVFLGGGEKKRLD